MFPENMRRMFYRWLAAARKARHRRLYLQQKEEELKSTVLAAAWDKWRERFLDIRLQPVVCGIARLVSRTLLTEAIGGRLLDTAAEEPHVPCLWYLAL